MRRFIVIAGLAASLLAVSAVPASAQEIPADKVWGWLDENVVREVSTCSPMDGSSAGTALVAVANILNGMHKSVKVTGWLRDGSMPFVAMAYPNSNNWTGEVTLRRDPEDAPPIVAGKRQLKYTFETDDGWVWEPPNDGTWNAFVQPCDGFPGEPEEPEPTVTPTPTPVVTPTPDPPVIIPDPPVVVDPAPKLSALKVVGQIKVDRKVKRATVKVSCSDGDLPCKATLTLKKGKAVIGRIRVSLNPSMTKAYKVKLGPKAKRAFGKSRKARITVVGGSKKPQSVTVQLPRR